MMCFNVVSRNSLDAFNVNENVLEYSECRPEIDSDTFRTQVWSATIITCYMDGAKLKIHKATQHWM
jgi:hypothetical protein